MLTPLRLADGSVFVLDRGWVSIGTKQDRPDSVRPHRPRARSPCEARLQAERGPARGPHRAVRRDPVHRPDGRSPSDVGAADLHGRVRAGAVGVPGRAAGAPPQRIEPQPADTGVDEGTHLSYAIQWILFALLGFGALGWSIRRDLLDAGDEVVTAAEERARRSAGRSARPPTSRVEDELDRRRTGSTARQLTLISSAYSGVQRSSVPSGMISTRSGFSASTAPSSWLTSTTAPV